MSEDKKLLKKRRYFASYMKERAWLESMAMDGWFLKNMVMGISYTFEKGRPAHMLYEVYRFNLPKKPTMEDILHKDIFIEMAEELGWKEVLHDESLTYYFCKEYVEGEINDLCNDEASRIRRGEKFNEFLHGQAKRMMACIVLLNAVNFFVQLETALLGEEMMGWLIWYPWFVIVLTLICGVFSLFVWKLGEMLRREMALTRQEWEEQQNPEKYKSVKKLIWTNRGLNRFLRREEEKGWILTSAGPRKYEFERKEGKDQIYTLDSRWLTNKRRLERKESRFNDRRDIEGMNNDWQIHSVKEAKEKGWTFVCALEARAIIYRGDAETVEPLNDGKYDNSLRFISIVGEYGVGILISGLIGGIIGGCLAAFGL